MDNINYSNNNINENDNNKEENKNIDDNGNEDAPPSSGQFL